MSFGLQLLDGQWIEWFDPDASATDPPSYPTGDGAATMDPAKALRFDTAADALAFWKQTSRVVPMRPDGKPNRPLTALTVTVEQLPEEE